MKVFAETTFNVKGIVRYFMAYFSEFIIFSKKKNVTLSILLEIYAFYVRAPRQLRHSKVLSIFTHSLRQYMLDKWLYWATFCLISSRVVACGLVSKHGMLLQLPLDRSSMD